MTDSYVTVRTDERVYGECRTETFLEDIFKIMYELTCRRRYREERAFPEWFDLGGEA